jgi:hypothetical protein
MALNISFTSLASKHLKTSESTLTVSEDTGIFAKPGNVVSGTKRTKLHYLQFDEKEIFFPCQEL